MLRIVLFFFLLVASVVQSKAQVPSISADVIEVQTFGSWQSDEQAGHYRLILTQSGFEHVKNNVFVQWIAVTDDGLRVIETVGIEEINDSNVYAVSVTTLEEGAWTLSLTNIYSYETKSIRLKPGLPGEAIEVSEGR